MLRIHRASTLVESVLRTCSSRCAQEQHRHTRPRNDWSVLVCLPLFRAATQGLLPFESCSFHHPTPPTPAHYMPTCTSVTLAAFAILLPLAAALDSGWFIADSGQSCDDACSASLGRHPCHLPSLKALDEPYLLERVKLDLGEWAFACPWNSTQSTTKDAQAWMRQLTNASSRRQHRRATRVLLPRQWASSAAAAQHARHQWS